MGGEGTHPAPDSEQYDVRLQRMQDCVRCLLQGVGEDTEREGLRDTPKVGYPSRTSPLELPALAHAVVMFNGGIIFDIGIACDCSVWPKHSWT